MVDASGIATGLEKVINALTALFNSPGVTSIVVIIGAWLAWKQRKVTNTELAKNTDLTRATHNLINGMSTVKLDEAASQAERIDSLSGEEGDHLAAVQARKTSDAKVKVDAVEAARQMKEETK